MSEVLRPGNQAPELELENQDEQLVSLAGLRGHPVIIYFFPEAFSPGCTTPRVVRSGTSSVTPSSVNFSTSHF